MRRGATTRLLRGLLGGGVGLMVIAPALAAEPGAPLDLPAQSLSVTLNQVARTGSAEVVFDRRITDAKRAPRLRGRLTIEQALEMALAGSGLGWRRNADGAFVVAKSPSAPSAPALPDPTDGAISEVMVLGRRSLNTGIRRSRDDIQPYDVADGDTLVRSGGETIEAFMRARMPANAQAASNVQAPVANMASTRSGIDLLGLGRGQTLVLVDGRRLPSLPAPVDPLSGDVWAGFGQADLNGIPLGAIERIEVLTSTAGAIYGPGATGGVVNVILKRDYHDADASFTQGLTTRGDAPLSRFDGHIGYASPDGRSGLALTVGLAAFVGLRVGDRGYFQAARLRRLQTASSFADLPVGNDINVSNPFRSGPYATGLTLDPEYGGQSLGASMTHFPVSGFSAAEAIANAGTLDTSLSKGPFGATQSLLTATRSSSLILSGRRQWGMFEGFVDAMLFETWGRAVGAAGDPSFSLILGDAPSNPFQEAITVSAPLPWGGALRNHNVTRRITAGLIANLPGRWTASIDASYSAATGRTSDDRPQQSLLAQIIGETDLTNPDYPQVSPFWSRQRFLDGYGAYLYPAGLTYKLQDRLQDLNLRASGPLWMLPGGPITMTVLAEARVERAPLGVYYGWSWLAVQHEKRNSPGISQTTGSVYGEWRAPLVSSQASGPLRGLEAQIALRADRVRERVPMYDDALGDILGRAPLKGEDTVTSKTLGLRTFLSSAVMLRASYADGYLPTTTQQLNVNVQQSFGTVTDSTDAKRGGSEIGGGEGFYVLFGGSPKLSAEKAATLSLGLVYHAVSIDGLRVSIDYLRTRKSREPTDHLRRNISYFIDREDQFPDRIIRAPLTDVDRARGFTAGVITAIDTTDLGIGRSIVESVDISADYRRDLSPSSRLHSYLRVTWQPSYRRIGDPDRGWRETAGGSDGPLRLRGNAGLDWSMGRAMVGMNLQYYGGRGVARSGFYWSYGTDEVGIQQASTMPAQAYVDIVLRRQFGRDGQTEVQLNVQNLLDTKAPLDANTDLGYSTYGDPRGRRLEMTVSRRF